VAALLGLLLAPLLLGLVRRTKALFAGRTGPPLLQAYLDLFKLFGKGAVYSWTTTWVFRAGPAVGLAGALAALALSPGGGPALVSFPGDVVLLVYLLALARFATLLAALDTGSAFEGMGASREAACSVFAEPALLLCLAALSRATGEWSLSGIYGALSARLWVESAGVMLLAAVALFGVLLVENARIPFDDPTTHLELTMVHEAMVLDHGGPDLALIELGAALKLWILSGLVAGVVVPVHGGSAWLAALAHLGGIAAVGIAIGVVESTMARLRLAHVPQILVGVGLLALLSLTLGPDLGGSR
jgi:formate hydrogenlyase subunit 4